MSRLRLLPIIFGFLILIFCSKGKLTKPNIIIIMTGQYSHVNGILDLDGTLEPENHYLACQEYLKRYLRCVKGVDDNVGRLFTYLEVND